VNSNLQEGATVYDTHVTFSANVCTVSVRLFCRTLTIWQKYSIQ